MKLKRGQKLCTKCRAINAARQRVCTQCEAKFKLKHTPLKNEVLDWHSLQGGESFRVINGTGPYYQVARDCGEGNKGDRLRMGGKGKYVVYSLSRDGINAHGPCGYEFIYMGKNKFDEELNIHRSPHRIVKINPKRKKH